MSIELLDKTRKINALLNDRRSSKVAFTDVCTVLGQLLGANVCVVSSKGKVLGTYVHEGEKTIRGFQNTRGGRIDAKLNERFLTVLSTKENVNLEMLGFLREDIDGCTALITPICIGGERFGTLFLYRSREPFGIEDIILSEYGTTVVGLEMMRAVQEETDQEAGRRKNFSSAVAALTALEQEAVYRVFCELECGDGRIVTSKLADEVGITRTVIVNGLRKMESAGVIRTRSAGVKGTCIEVLNEFARAENFALSERK